MKNTGAVYNTAQGQFDSSKGDLRLVGVTAGVGGRSYMNYQKVPMKLDELCSDLNQKRRELLDVDDDVAKYILSFDTHFKLVTIHPWVDGNGRMARLVMNLLQYEFGLMPSKIQKENKAEYIQALIDSRERESLEPIREFLLSEHIANLAREIAEYKRSLVNESVLKMSERKSENVREKKKNVRERRILDLIKANGSITLQQIATELGVNERTIRRDIVMLKDRGVIVREGGDFGGKWVII